MLEASFIDGQKGRLFQLIQTPSARDTKSAVLILPSFAEEMNKSRRMYALTARALAADGYLCLIPDFYGTGDSEGDFSDADLSVWQADLITISSRLAEQGTEQIIILAHRTGALLVPTLVDAMPSISKILFWHAAINGKQFLTQFLRLRLAANMDGSGKKETTSELREQLYAGTSVEVAGYEIAPSLAKQLDQALLSDWLPPSNLDLHWFEISADIGKGLLPVSQKLLDRWSTSGVRVTPQVVEGSAFWSTQEIAECGALVTATLQAMQGPSR